MVKELIATFLLAVLVVTVAGVTTRAKECQAPMPAGVWESASGGSRNLVRIEVMHTCSKNRAGVVKKVEGQTWTIRAWSLCRPRNCVWGRSSVTVDKPGFLDVSFNNYIAKRRLRIETEGERIRVSFHVDYRKRSRSDVTGQLLMVRFE